MAFRTKQQLLDEYLVASARTGDRKAFDLLARRWQGKLVAHAWRLTGDVDHAREAAQEGWIEIVRGLGRLRDERAFPAWAYQIVSRRCARRIGGLQRDRALVAAAAAEPVEAFIAPEEGDAPAMTRLRAGLAALPPGQRAVIGLFYLEELGVADVATALNVPAGTVKTRLLHARRKLRAVLEGEA
ncbi:RNA polymerase sigma factor [Brevundimonas sp.]|uniref:RNA polymerase sigma factor n=1 Tax=Brevundimonas sp. TaxID=1871086 RepID=UPI002ED776CF